MQYIHERDEWPRFTWDDRHLAPVLAMVRHRQGRLIGRMESLGFALRAEATLRTLTEDVVKTSAIEGEALDRAEVRSSIARHMGMDIAGLVPADRHVDGVVEMTLDATQHYSDRLDAGRLFNWHAALFPTGRSGMNRITVGAWRSRGADPMRVVSGPIGRERTHFEAPAADKVDPAMQALLDWLEDDSVTVDPVVRAGIAHLWFLTIHPFEDGNGRIARAVADLALARSEQSKLRFYSMSAQIQAERQAYYDALEKARKGTLDVTGWLDWFLGCLNRAFDGAEAILAPVLLRARFWDARDGMAFNERQRLLLNRLLGNFEGKLTTSKWARIARCSQDTALRDIDDLVTKGILMRDGGGGRSTSYSLAPI